MQLQMNGNGRPLCCSAEGGVARPLSVSDSTSRKTKGDTKEFPHLLTPLCLALLPAATSCICLIPHLYYFLPPSPADLDTPMGVWGFACCVNGGVSAWNWTRLPRMLRARCWVGT